MRVEWTIAAEVRFVVEVDDWEQARLMRNRIRESLDQRRMAAPIGEDKIPYGMLMTTTSKVPEGEDSVGKEVQVGPTSF